MNDIAKLPPGLDLQPLVLIRGRTRHFGALMDEIHFVWWQAPIARRNETEAIRDAIEALDTYMAR